VPLLRSRFARERVRSAGSAPADQINPDVIAVKGELRIDSARRVLRGADIVITMGCDEARPVLRGRRYLDWHIQDPSGREVEDVRRIRQDIADHVLDLLKELLP